MNDASVGIGILLVSLVCLGTWPALLRLCSTHHPRGSCCCCGCLFHSTPRHPCHAYIDYSLAYVIASVIPMLLFLFNDWRKHSHDEAGAAYMNEDKSSETSFLSRWPLVGAALLGGTLLSLGNISFQWATVVFQAPLTTVLCIQASMTVVLGTFLNYLLQPARTAHPPRLLAGICAFLMAIFLAAQAQIYHVGLDDNLDENQLTPTDAPYGYDAVELTQPSGGTPRLDRPQSDPHDGLNDNYEDNKLRLQNLSKSNDEDASINLPAAALTVPIEHNEEAGWKKRQYGLWVAVVGGLCFGFFSPLFNIAVNDPLQWTLSDGMSVAVANLWFALAFGTTSIAWNGWTMSYHPGSIVPPSSWKEYTRPTSRRLAVAAGIICALGNVLQFQGGRLAGFAASDLVQAYPLVATIWDVLLFGEYRPASSRVAALLGIMYLFYLLGIVLLASSIVK